MDQAHNMTLYNTLNNVTKVLTVGSVMPIWLSTAHDNQPSLHSVDISTDVISEYTGHRDTTMT